LEVGVELDDTELEFLVSVIICSEIVRVQNPDTTTQGVQETKEWKTILLEYGSSILRKSLKHLSFVLFKDELRISEPRMVVQLSDGGEYLYLDRHSYLSNTKQELGSYQGESLARIIIEDFASRFNASSELAVGSSIRDDQKVSDEIPTLITLMNGKMDGSPPKRAQVHHTNFSGYLNVLRTDPILTRLSQLCEQIGMDRERLYLWEILEHMYRASFVRLQELRFPPSSLAQSRTGHDVEATTILGSDLGRKLFWLVSSGTRTNREKYSRIQDEFTRLTNSEFG
jgi:hypothetical protein